jgi:hypothetical protein|tara:strand:+ start:191 stop:607 length:417 start_codon:yes stop_codon:yes gene_type:complete
MQVTVAKSFFKKIDLLKEKAEQEIKNKASDIVSDAVDLSPVDTGAFVESWQINPRGERTSRSRSSANRPKLPEGSKQAKREEEKSRLLGRVESFDLEQLSGFTVTNRAPHIAEMNKSDRLRTGYSPSEIQAVLKDRFR